ncbi:MAG: ABC transporter permease [Proteobacteria bacterium]|nr:ABC transporter permease [Pseudomonadota bacterium]
MTKLLAIAKNTYREAIRDRILYGFLFFAIALILFSVVLGRLSFNQQVRCTMDVGLAGVSFFSVLIAIFLGITLLHKEIEKRTIYPVLAKPVSRTTYLLGKFLGLAATLAVQMALMLAVFLVLLKVEGAELTAGLFVAVAFIFVETLLVVAMALFFTSFSSPFLSGLFCLGLFAAGRNAQLLEALAKNKDLAWMGPVMDGVTAVVPNLYLFYPSGKMVEQSWATVLGQYVSNGYAWHTIGYGIAYTALFLTLAVVLLGRRDFA